MLGSNLVYLFFLGVLHVYEKFYENFKTNTDPFSCGRIIKRFATSPKVQVAQAGDNHLTKEQLLCEIDKLNDAERQVDSKRGVTGTNVAAALFFWPGLVYTHMDASEASRLIEQRRSHLTALYNQKLAQGGRR
jgi:hypothetical protein